jgi:hypothetical protein
VSDYSEFFLNSRADIVQLELLEVSHPDFTQPYRIVRNAADGVTVSIPGRAGTYDFGYYPAKVTSIGARDDLDTGVRVELGDLGEIVPSELDAVDAAGGMFIKPTVLYWVYRSDDLTAPIYGPLALEIRAFNFDHTGAAFEAVGPQLNQNRTGELYRLERFPMLRGFL